MFERETNDGQPLLAVTAIEFDEVGRLVLAVGAPGTEDDEDPSAKSPPKLRNRGTTEAIGCIAGGS
jgi:hypothetical protein